jgi:hypothetical protein
MQVCVLDIAVRHSLPAAEAEIPYCLINVSFPVVAAVAGDSFL